MNDKKLTGNLNITLIVSAIVLVVYNVIAFVVPIDRNSSFWTTYAFQMIAIILSALVASYATKKPTLKSLYLGISLFYVAMRYVITELVVGTLLLLLPTALNWVSIIAQVVILAVFLICVIVTDRAKDVIESTEAHIATKRQFVQSNLATVEGLIDTTTDDELRKNLQNLAETIKFSDPMSTDDVAELEEIESEIDREIVNLQTAIQANESTAKAQINDVELLFKKRNRLVKQAK
ncbi:MAG: hypothetical protein LBL41_03655 [Bifidobacteriaceae bacterium]|jgi:hypothetical protein|nr:hypothetical protein [Bifidobacteriaceae bacterium]